MMKRGHRLMSLITFVSISLLGMVSQSANLLANGGFENVGTPVERLFENLRKNGMTFDTDNPALPMRWDYYGSRGKNMMRLTEDARSGKHALEVKVGPKSSFKMVMRVIEVLPGAKYDFGIQAKGEGEGTLVVMGAAYENWKELARKKIELKPEWTDFSETAIIPGGTIRSISYEIRFFHDSKAIFDDAYVTVDSDRSFDANTVLTQKPLKDEHTLLLLDFDGDEKCSLHHGAKITEDGKGRFGKGLRFDRKQASNAFLPFNLKEMPKEGTLEFWFSPEDAPKKIYNLMTLLGGGGKTVMLAHAATDRKISCRWRIDDSRFGKKHSITCPWQSSYAWLRKGNWHHMAIQWDGNAVRYYLNGVLAGINAQEPQPFFWKPDGILLGSKRSHTCWSGMIDEVRLSDVQRYGPVLPKGMEWKPLHKIQLASTKEVKVDFGNENSGKSKRKTPDFAKEREKQIAKIPTAPKEAIIFEAVSAKPLIENAKYFKILKNSPTPEMTVASINKGGKIAEPDKYGAYWKLNDIKPGKYWLGIWYESKAGAPQSRRGAFYVYLNGRVVQFDRTSDCVQVAKGVYYAEGQSASGLELKAGDEIAVLPGYRVPLRMARLTLYSEKPAPGRGWMPLRTGQSKFTRRSSLGLYIDASFPVIKGKKVQPTMKWLRQQVETGSPSNLKKADDGKRALAQCIIGNPLPVPLKVEFNAEIKSYFRKLVGSEKASFTVPAHGTVTREIPFEIIPDSKRYTILATAKAINPPDLGWPDDTFSYFPGLRQNLPFPDPFFGKDEISLKFTGVLRGQRQDISLNGIWESAFTTDLNPPASPPKGLKWRKRPVPFATWQCRIADIKPRPHGIYLRREFTVPETENQNSWQILLSKVGEEATIYVNGTKVGNIRGRNAPLTCDITKAVKPGKNELIIVVRDLLAIMNPAYVNPKAPVPCRDYLDAPGLFGLYSLNCGSVMLKSYPAVYAHDALVVPSCRKKELSGRFELSNNSSEEKKLKVVTKVLDAGEFVLNLDEKEISLPAGKTELLKFAKTWNNPILWGPGNPHLYTLAVEVLDATTGKRLDLMRERFGFRESYVKGNRLYFNGKPVNYKGSSTHGGQGQRVDDVNLTRTPRLPYFMDEFGYLASQTLGGISNTSSRHNVERDQFWETATKNVLNGVKLLGNHPSIIAWDLSNEWMCFLDYGGGDPMQAARRFKTLDNAVKKLDPSRWSLFNGDEDLHGLHDTYSTHYMMEATNPRPMSDFRFRGHSNYFPDGAFFRPLERDFIPGEEIVVNVFRNAKYNYGEKVLMNTENTWKVGAYMPPGPCKFVDEDDVLSPAIDSGRGPVAWMWKQNIDGHRDLGVGALYNYTHIYGVTRRGHMLQCFIIPDHTHHYFSGQEFKRRYSLLNEIFEPAEFSFKWSLVSPTGKVVEKGEDTRKMKTGDLQRAEFSFKTPDVDKKTKFILKLELLADGKFVYGEERDIEVFANRPTPVGDLKRKIFVFDPAGDTTKILTKAGIPFETTDLSDEAWKDPASNALIIGVDAVTKIHPFPKEKLASFTKQGGRVLVLRQTKTMPGLPVKTDLEPREWSSMPFVRTPQHPVLQGISSWDLKFWNPGHVTAKGAWSKPLSGPALVLVDSGQQYGLEYVQMMECYRGEGLYLLNQLLVIEDYETEPMARELLARMIRYIGGDKVFRQPVKKLLLMANPSKQVIDRLKKLNIDFSIIQKDQEITANDVLFIDALTLAPDFRFPKQWREAMKQGADIIVHNAAPENQPMLANLAGKKVGLEAQPIDIWEGRGYRNGFDELTAGLSHIDLYWKQLTSGQTDSCQAESKKNKIEDIVFWSASAPSAKELIYPGALLEIPVGQGRLVIDQVRWQTDNQDLDTKADRYLIALMSGLEVKITPFVEPCKLPKHVQYAELDLSPFANRGFIDEKGDDGEGGWSDQGPKFDLRQFPAKQKYFGRIPFKIGQEPKSCIVLKSMKRPHPEKVPAEVSIPIDQEIEGLYFLHSCSYTMRGQVGLYQIEYEDGSVIDIPLVNGINIRDWAAQPAGFPREKETKTKVIWTGACEGFSVICVYRMLWVNPKPEVAVKSVRFSNPDRRGCPILIALTKVLKKQVDPEKLAAQRKKAEKLFKEGSEAFKAGDDHKAKAALEKAVAADANYIPAYQTLVQVCEKLKDEKAALACYKAWIRAGAQTPLPYNRVGAILERNGDLKGALEAYSKSLEVEWNQPPVIEAKSKLQKIIAK